MGLARSFLFYPISPISPFAPSPVPFRVYSSPASAALHLPLFSCSSALRSHCASPPSHLPPDLESKRRHRPPSCPPENASPIASFAQVLKCSFTHLLTSVSRAGQSCIKGPHRQSPNLFDGPGSELLALQVSCLHSSTLAPRKPKARPRGASRTDRRR